MSTDLLKKIDNFINNSESKEFSIDIENSITGEEEKHLKDLKEKKIIKDYKIEQKMSYSEDASGDLHFPSGYKLTVFKPKIKT